MSAKQQKGVARATRGRGVPAGVQKKTVGTPTVVIPTGRHSGPAQVAYRQSKTFEDAYGQEKPRKYPLFALSIIALFAAVNGFLMKAANTGMYEDIFRYSLYAAIGIAALVVIPSVFRIKSGTSFQIMTRGIRILICFTAAGMALWAILRDKL
jgi:hypothetical protein